MTLMMDGRGTVTGMEAQIWELTKAALTPARNRAATMLQKLQARPHAQVKTAKAARPQRMTRRRSWRSETGPATRANSAYPRA